MILKHGKVRLSNKRQDIASRWVDTLSDKYVDCARRTTRAINDGVVSAPVKLEIHPSWKCTYDCVYCIGGGLYKDSDIFLARDDFLGLVESAGRYGVKELIISGLFGEPLLNSNCIDSIKEAKKWGMTVGLYTNGYLLDEYLRRVLVKESRLGDYIAVSIDAGLNSVYCDIKRPRDFDGRKVFSVVVNNLAKLRDERDKHGAPLKVNLYYHLLPTNCDDQNLSEIIRIAREVIGADNLRFGVALPPITDGFRQCAMSYDEYKDTTIQRIASERNLSPLRVYLPDGPIGKVELPFDRCVVRDIFAVVASDGNVYPCCYTAAPAFGDLSIGNIYDRGFVDIWEDLETRKRRAPMPGKDCEYCSRVDFAINVATTSCQAGT